MLQLLLFIWTFTNSSFAEPTTATEPETTVLSSVEGSSSVPLAKDARGVGLGASLGEPTGVAFAWRPNGPSTIAGVAGWSINRRHIHVHTDYQFTVYRLKLDPQMDFLLEFFVGLGGTVDLGNGGGNRPSLGARIPSGVYLTFGDTPVDVFLELVPVMGLIPDTVLYFDGALGFRVWLDPR